MNLKVQRYKKGHPYYSEAWIENLDDKKGAVGKFQSVFGEMRDVDTGKLIAYTMERKDTITSDGTYNITYHDSPSNHCICPHLVNDSLGVAKERYILIHPANWAFQLKGCTAVGTGVSKTMISNSKKTFDLLMKLLNNKPSTITYKTY